MKRFIKNGFSVAELIIVISVVLILVAAALQTNSGLQKTLQFNNVFQQTLSYVQRARTLALTSTDASYGVRVYIDERRVEIIKQRGAAIEVRESFTAPPVVRFNVMKTGGDCGTPSRIMFAPVTGEVTISCDPEIFSVIVQMCKVLANETSSRCPPNTGKRFVIHKASGVPQIQ